MINILEAIPNPNDATSFYRGRLPLLRLQKQYPDQIMLYPYHNGSVNWDYILLFDLVFLQRPADSHYFNILRAAKQFGIPVWIDYDDLICDIPKDNPACDAYTTDKIEMIGDFIKFSDIVTVSTNALKFYMEERYGVKNKIKVIPNSFDQEVFSGKPVFKKSKNIVWRGSCTHQNDLLHYSEEIIGALNDNPKWNINFMGWDPWFITSRIKNHTYTKGLPIDKYLGLLGNLNNSICIVPLHDNSFNHSKSNIAWVESTYAGAVCLAPDWEEWKKPGIVNYRGKLDFKKKLKAMIAGEYDLKHLHKQSWQYISDHLSLSKANNLRKEIIMRQSVS